MHNENKIIMKKSNIIIIYANIVMLYFYIEDKLRFDGNPIHIIYMIIFTHNIFYLK